MLKRLKRNIAHLFYFLITGCWQPVFPENGTTSQKLTALADHIDFNKDKFKFCDRDCGIVGMGISFANSNVYGLTMTYRFKKLYDLNVKEVTNLITGNFERAGSKKHPNFVQKEFYKITPEMAVEVVRELAAAYAEKEFYGGEVCLEKSY